MELYQREREREGERGREGREGEREIVCVCVCEREREHVKMGGIVLNEKECMQVKNTSMRDIWF